MAALVEFLEFPLSMFPAAERQRLLEQYPAMVRALAGLLAASDRQAAAFRQLGIRPTAQWVRCRALLDKMETEYVRVNSALYDAVEEAQRRRMFTGNQYEQARELLQRVGAPVSDVVMRSSGLGVVFLVWAALVAIVIIVLPPLIILALRAWPQASAEATALTAATDQAIALSRETRSVEPLIELERGRVESRPESTSSNIASTAGYGAVIVVGALLFFFLMGQKARKTA